MKKQFNTSNTSEIRTLLNVALACLDAGEMDRLAWRLADAAGILREELAGKFEGGLCGLDEPTGRGYMLPAKSAEQIQPVALVEFRSVYGNETIYPVNYEAERFAAIAGKKTLSRTDLMNIKALGFSVVQDFPSKIAA